MSRDTTSPREPGLKIIHVSLFRSGTKSMAAAYRLLGYKAHHGLDDVWKNQWGEIEKAAEATWPEVPGAIARTRFERSDWDRLWGADYDVATDLASPFADQLIEAYPEAKVVIVQRSFDSWWPSFRSENLISLFGITGILQTVILTRILGIRAAEAMRKVYFGFFEARSLPEIEAHAREKYEAYYENIRKKVPLERRLEYKLGSGWQPLCEFLNVDVPTVDFPRENDRTSHARGRDDRSKVMYMDAIKTLSPYLAALGVMVLGVGVARGYFGRQSI